MTAPVFTPPFLHTPRRWRYELLKAVGGARAWRGMDWTRRMERLVQFGPFPRPLTKSNMLGRTVLVPAAAFAADGGKYAAQPSLA